MSEFQKKGSVKNWRIQKGNEVAWFKGHRKGTGVVTRIVGQIDLKLSISGGESGEYEVRDDATGEVMRFSIRDLARKKKASERRS